ncbi:hypothetical protein JVT61DRAFT_10457 [Boletus reticuloceps]|uniref:Uncharacterized protein n=1 Tax=Boletus reticuloceps TaxID=495285 RepID=A0A8I3ADX4_9AGAM|nr:hypothetical protein JVT61DRAFT_10457 [Boletus reticuloceps]
MDLGRVADGVDADVEVFVNLDPDANPDVVVDAILALHPDSDAILALHPDPDANAVGDAEDDADAVVDADANATLLDLHPDGDACAAVPVLVGIVDAPANLLRQPSSVWFVPSLNGVEAVLAGRTAELEAVGVRAGIARGYRVSALGARGRGATGRAGTGLCAGTGAGAGAGARFAGMKMGLGAGAGTGGTSRRAPCARPTPSCASTLSSAATISRRSSHCGHGHVFHRARQR